MTFLEVRLFDLKGTVVVTLVAYPQLLAKYFIRVVYISFVDVFEVDLLSGHLCVDIVCLGNHLHFVVRPISHLYLNFKLNRLFLHTVDQALY